MYTIQNPASPRVQAIFLKAHLRLRIAGLKGTVTDKVLFSKVAAITGKTYARNQMQKALSDIVAFLDS